MFKIIAITLAVLIAAVLIYASTRPDTFQVQRTIRIKAPPEKIFPLIGELRAWLDWSPYEKKDPEMKRTFSGQSAGEGAVYAWDGNAEIGAGSMEITQSLPPLQTGHQTGFRPTVRMPQYRGIHAETRGRDHAGYLGDARTHAVHHQSRDDILQHGQDGRQRLRGGPYRPQGNRRKRSSPMRKRI